VFSGPLAQWHLLRRVGLGVSIAAAIYGAPALAQSLKSDSFEPDPIPWSQLPAEGQEVRRLIESGGPFRYDQDGRVFANRERALPRRQRGFYREYTVAAPGSRDRGARRIVCGGEAPRMPIVCYYTADHYKRFRRITP
jgi:ribonuclease T1